MAGLARDISISLRVTVLVAAALCAEKWQHSFVSELEKAVKEERFHLGFSVKVWRTWINSQNLRGGEKPLVSGWQGHCFRGWCQARCSLRSKTARCLEDQGRRTRPRFWNYRFPGTRAAARLGRQHRFRNFTLSKPVIWDWTSHSSLHLS